MRDFQVLFIETFASLREVFGFVPNLFRIQTRLPRVIEAQAGIARAVLLDEGALSRTEKLCISLAVATARRNTYWVAAHYSMLQSFTTALSNFLCALSTALDPSLDFEPRAIPYKQKASRPDRRAYFGDTSGRHPSMVDRSYENCPPFAFFRQHFGFVPHIFRAETLRPNIIGAETDLIRSVLLPEDSLSHFQKQCILLVSSVVNLRTCCGTAYCEMLRATGVPVENSDQIASDHHFLIRLTARPVEFQRHDVKALRRHGFTDEHILETAAATALNEFFNTLQIGLDTTPAVEPRRVFQPERAQGSAGLEAVTHARQVDPDTELVTRVQNGDLEAFEGLVNRHSRRVFRVLVAMIGNHDEAQDAMQDTFLKAFEHIGQFERRSKFSTWLLAIASNKGLQRLRDRRPLERFDESAPEAEFRPRQVAAWQAGPEQQYSLAERRRLIEAGLMKVPSIYRVVLVLRDLEQLSTEEAAAALGLGIPAVKARLFRGRQMLREALSPHFERRDRDRLAAPLVTPRQPCR